MKTTYKVAMIEYGPPEINLSGPKKHPITTWKNMHCPRCLSAKCRCFTGTAARDIQANHDAKNQAQMKALSRILYLKGTGGEVADYFWKYHRFVLTPDRLNSLLVESMNDNEKS